MCIRRKKTFRHCIVAAALAMALPLLYSCSTPKDIAYFQDATITDSMALQLQQQFRLRPEDKIYIVVSSSNPMLEKQFTLAASASNRNTSNTTNSTSAGLNSSGSQIITYTVDEQGTIDFPVLGKIRVADKTRGEVAAYIKKRLIERELVSDPIVTVEYANLSVNVIGEVSKPGNIAISKDHFTIIDAISQAGDLTINGNRRNVMVNRNCDGVNKVYYIDLTNMQNTLISPAYYLQQNDLVYIAPNEKRKRESANISNATQSPYFWISVASMITAITSLIFR
ncbi:MAG: polysaccharide biosynthesis/export family protein [Bacteroidaceae bacterium]|nr:polysaccharide biosynthesis/export family protein [Bacteroidaceae bacterium]